MSDKVRELQQSYFQENKDKPLIEQLIKTNLNMIL